MDNKKLIIGLISGAILGIVCIVGASLRSENQIESLYLFSFWFNRLLIGGVIGISISFKSLTANLLKGFILGTIISFAFYSSTNFSDPMGFVAGAVYGIMIEWIIFKFLTK